MYTPQEVQDKKFPKAVFGGYDMGEVDDFLDAVSADYAALYKENAVLKSKMKVLAEKVEEYRGVDAAMRKALILAQKMANDMTEDAKAKSEEIRTKAQEDYENTIASLKDNIKNEERRLEKLKEETKTFVESTIRVCEIQIKKFKTMMSEPVTVEKQESVEETADEIEKTISRNIERAEVEENYTADTGEFFAESMPEPDAFAEKRADISFDTNGKVNIDEEYSAKTPDEAETAGVDIPWIENSPALKQKPALNAEKGQEVNVGGMNIRVFKMDLGKDKS